MVVKNLLKMLGPYAGNVTFSPIVCCIIEVETRQGKVNPLLSIVVCALTIFLVGRHVEESVCVAYQPSR